MERHASPTRDATGRWPVLDAAEVAIRNEPTWPVLGARRAQVLARRAEAERALTRVDAAIAELVAERRSLIERIAGCNLALVGTNEIRDRHSGAVLQRLPWRRRIPLVDPMPFVACVDDDRISGEALRESTVALLRAVDEPMTVAELERLLRASGVLPAGRPSKSISDALRLAVRGGCVERVSRGTYRAA